MANPPPDPEARTIKFITSIGDTAPFRKLLRSLARLYDQMAAGELTLEQATDELELILTTLMGETL